MLLQVPIVLVVIVVVLLVVAIPFGLLSLPHFGHSAGLVPLMPTDAAATHTVKELQSIFGIGAVFPTSLLLVLPEEWQTSKDNLTAWREEACQALLKTHTHRTIMCMSL